MLFSLLLTQFASIAYTTMREFMDNGPNTEITDHTVVLCNFANCLPLRLVYILMQVFTECVVDVAC